jgi:hypothetical protein
MAIAYVRNTESVTSETFDEDTVLINFLTGTYFSLRGSAPLIWRLLQTATSLDEILASVGGDTGDARDSVRAMLDTLIAENCVHSVEVDEAEIGRSNSRTLVPYTAPIVETFHDLQELIVVDPVHEVDEIDGWPHRPSPLKLE